MHGDDVASAGVSVSTQIVSKATEILLDMLKVAIEKEREAARKKQSEKQQVLSGGEVTYQKLKEGGEVTMLPSFAKTITENFSNGQKKWTFLLRRYRNTAKKILFPFSSM
ncbi:MAG: hypothetical protein L6V87_02140 [Ruminococcus sp.]|nr:MAG: hypothetical protein L6V87_02140 [Ruminococcus sp.]